MAAKNEVGCAMRTMVRMAHPTNPTFFLLEKP